MDEETNDLIARLYLSEKNMGRVEPRELAAWAAQLILRGRETESLRKLATASNAEDLADTERLFRESIAELGWEIPKKKAVMKRHAEGILRRIVDGDIEPYDGCSHLYIISIYLRHPDYLYNWNGLFWEREDLELDELNELILHEAQRALGVEVSPRNESIRRRDEEDEKSPGFWDHLRRLIRWL